MICTDQNWGSCYKVLTIMKLLGRLLSWKHVDSLMAAIHFKRRFDASIKYVINSQEHPIGKVKDFIYRVEFKITGSCP